MANNYNSKLQINNTALSVHNTDLRELIKQASALPDAGSEGLNTNDATATAGDILAGETAYVKGNKITGTIPTVVQPTPDITINSSGLITATTTQAAGYVSAGTKSGTKQLTTQSAKTITPTKSSQTAVASGVYTTGTITVDAIPSEYITTNDANAVASNILSGKTAYVNGSKVTGTMPNNGAMSKSMDGINTKSVTIPAGYTSGGSVNLDSTIDNEVSTQADLIAQIKSTVNGLPNAGGGSSSGGSGDSSELFEQILSRGIITASHSTATTIGSYAFAYCTSLTTANFPAATSIGSGAFLNCNNLATLNIPAAINLGNNAFECCTSLTSANFPNAKVISTSAFASCCKLTNINFSSATDINNYAFRFCSSLASVNFPAVTKIQASAFGNCSSLTTASFPKATLIGNTAFHNCRILSALYLAGSTICTLSNSNAFNSTPFAKYSTYFSGTPHIYVPASLVDAYKTATNWTYFASYITTIPTITFTIDDVSYQAEEGMTWSEWVDSEYNTVGAKIDSDGDILIPNPYHPLQNEKFNDTIRNNGEYQVIFANVGEDEEEGI